MASAQRPLPIRPGPPVAILVPGADTMAAASDPASVILDWARWLGFDGVTYFPSPAAPIALAPATVWSTWSERWQRAWREAGYASADPRLVATAGQSLPCLWDGGVIVARGRLRRFLDEAAREGIRSGVAIPIGTARGRAIVAFDSSVAPVAPARRAAIHARLGELLWAAHAVHASRHVDPPPRAPVAAGARDTLSGREHECLAMSARGLTSRDIAAKLGIASRTVDFHVGKALVKLAALNRHEAIAKAIARGWLD
ncbi:MAG: autoinducer binding domain-containing protein [Burkholderiales bacterium]